ncbi:MAG: transglycosylase SLT domain-containing protein [Limnohabitans sp.]
MTALTNPLRRWQSPTSLILDIRAGFVELTHHSLALVGLTVLVVVLTFATRPSLQTSASEWLMGWLTSRQDEPLAQTVQELLPEQAKVTHWLSRKYKVAPQPLSTMVAEAWQLGQLSQVPPTLILAVMAVESGFNPFAKGSQGGMGLMQIVPMAHDETLQQFGGRLAAFDPVTNMRIGARLLQASIQQGGSIEEGLRQYSRAAGQLNDGAYIERVLAEQKQLDRIAGTRATTAQADHSTRQL